MPSSPPFIYSQPFSYAPVSNQLDCINFFLDHSFFAQEGHHIETLNAFNVISAVVCISSYNSYDECVDSRNQLTFQSTLAFLPSSSLAFLRLVFSIVSFIHCSAASVARRYFSHAQHCYGCIHVCA